MNDSGTIIETDSPPVYDESFWPIFVVRMPPERLSLAAFTRHLDRCSALHDQKTPFCLLLDMGHHPPLPPVQRKMSAARLKLDQQRRPGMMMALAVVVLSAFERGVVTAINWVAQPPYPVRTFATAGEGLTWLKQVLAKGGKGRA